MQLQETYQNSKLYSTFRRYVSEVQIGGGITGYFTCQTVTLLTFLELFVPDRGDGFGVLAVVDSPLRHQLDVL